MIPQTRIPIFARACVSVHVARVCAPDECAQIHGECILVRVFVCVRASVGVLARMRSGSRFRVKGQSKEAASRANNPGNR